MIHRLALLIGGTGAAGVLALALALGGFGTPLPNSPDAFATANDALGGGQLPADAPTVQPTTSTSLGGGSQETPKKVVDIVYVLPAPAPAVHTGKPANDANEPADTPRPPRDDNNGGTQAGDDQNGDDQGDESNADDENDGSDDQAGEDDHSGDGDYSDDGGNEPGDD